MPSSKPATKTSSKKTTAKSKSSDPQETPKPGRSRVGSGGSPGNKNAVGNPGGGRDGVYRPGYHPRMAEGVLLLNPQITNRELGELFGVAEVTIEAWKLRYPVFRRACGLQSRLVDGSAARSLYKRATGCAVKATKIFYDKESICPVCRGKAGNLKCEHCSGSGFGKIVKVSYRENYPPETKAAIFWLMNRAGWKTNKSSDWTGDLRMTNDDEIDISILPVELQEKILEALLEAKAKKEKGR